MVLTSVSVEQFVTKNPGNRNGYLLSTKGPIPQDAENTKNVLMI